MRTVKELQQFLGVEPDGLWGKKSQEAFDVVFQAQIVPEKVDNDFNLWPKEADAPNFYGHSDGSSRWEAENLVTFEAPYALYMDGQRISRIRCHKKVESSLKRILSQIAQAFPTTEARAEIGIDQYDGCYNYRAVRGASHLSMHAYGAAVDFDSSHNPLGATKGKMHPTVVAIFKAEGWRWGGDYTGRKDWMHFEACR
jgi:hypothetical protein